MEQNHSAIHKLLEDEVIRQITKLDDEESALVLEMIRKSKTLTQMAESYERKKWLLGATKYVVGYGSGILAALVVGWDSLLELASKVTGG